VTLAHKSALATVILAVAVSQLGLIGAGRGWWLSLSSRGRLKAVKAHRAAGYAGLLLIFIIAYYCVFVFGSTGTIRSTIHAFLGASVVMLVTVKVMVARVFRGYLQRLPVLGAALAAAITGAWATSALWYFIYF